VVLCASASPREEEPASLLTAQPVSAKVSASHQISVEVQIMARVEKVIDFQVRIRAGVGRLAQLLDALAKAKINGRAITAWEEPGAGYVHFVANDPRRAAAALGKMSPKPRVTKCPGLVVTLKNGRGAALRVAKALAAVGINIEKVVATAAGAGNFLLLLHTDRDAKALRIIQKL
jgi:hypothetical protein